MSAAAALGLAIVANAFGRRFAGGLLGQWFGPIGGTQVARLAQAAIVGLTVALLAPAWWGAVIIPFVFLGATMGFPLCGMVPIRPRHVWDIAWRHGLASTAPIALGLSLCHFISYGFSPAPLWSVAVLCGVGLLRGPAYWVATLWQPHIPVLGLNSDGLPDPPAWAEFLSGGALGAGLVVSLWSVA